MCTCLRKRGIVSLNTSGESCEQMQQTTLTSTPSCLVRLPSATTRESMSRTLVSMMITQILSRSLYLSKPDMTSTTSNLSVAISQSRYAHRLSIVIRITKPIFPQIKQQCLLSTIILSRTSKFRKAQTSLLNSSISSQNYPTVGMPSTEASLIRTSSTSVSSILL